LYSSAERNFDSGAASWVRMSRAYRPPTTKKTIAVTPYMMPTRLWSTVVTQDRHPVVAFGRVKIPIRGAVVVPVGRAS
jgi:hypothetical protein